MVKFQLGINSCDNPSGPLTHFQFYFDNWIFCIFTNVSTVCATNVSTFCVTNVSTEHATNVPLFVLQMFQRALWLFTVQESQHFHDNVTIIIFKMSFKKHVYY